MTAAWLRDGAGLAFALAMSSPAQAAAGAALPVHIGGRVAPAAGGGFDFGWPGTYFEARFRGTGVTVVTGDRRVPLRLLVDGRAVRILPPGPPARTELRGLAPAPHTIRLDAVGEDHDGPSRFTAFLIGQDSKPLPPPQRGRQIEFLGDSYTVGYGNLSPDRKCTPDQVPGRTDPQQAFGPVLARALGADYQLLGYSGAGVVRNVGGSTRRPPFPTLYERTMPSAPQAWPGSPDWHPQIVVAALGVNDFSMPLHGGERWSSQQQLRADFIAAYAGLVRRAAARNPGARILLLSRNDLLPVVAQVASALDQPLRARVTLIGMGTLALTGCDGHPSAGDHRAIAARLQAAIARLPLSW